MLKYISLWLIAATAVSTATFAAPVVNPLAASPHPLWTADKAAHLFRRAGFGGSPEQVQHLLKLGRDKAVDLLIDYENTPQDDPDYPTDSFNTRPPRARFAALDKEQRARLGKIGQRIMRGNSEAVRDWWLRRMVVSPRPMEEKMTLFWHGHFTSGIKEVRDPRAMYTQNQFLRTHALSDFKTLLMGISRDAAMLAYLDNGKNVKKHPNENYARELMELFTLGEGNYSEQDVKEAARAFTGWSANQEGEFYIRTRDHDDGDKTFLGRTGRFDGDDIVNIILEQPACAKYLARKLWKFFVETNPDEKTVDALAEHIRASDYDIRETMRTIFLSDVFYAPKARAALIKSPAELLVSSARVMEVPVNDLRAANQQMAQMGQELFQPPNVKGWDGGCTWINTSTLFIRYNAMAGLLNGTRPNMREKFRDVMAERLGAIGIGTNRVKTMQIAALGKGKSSGDEDDGGAMMAMPQDGDTRELAEAIKTLPEEAKEWLRNIKLPPYFSQPQPQYDPMPVLQKYKLNTPQSIVDHYVSRLLPIPLPDGRKQVLLRAMVADSVPFDPRGSGASDRIRGMIHLIMSMPEYQLN